jgi:two-component system response regulator MprA
VKRVLIAEDDTAIRTFLAQALADEGYIVETAVNGAVALERCAAFAPDVVVLDLMMPLVDGFQFLRRRGSGCTAPVVVISAAYQSDAVPPGLGIVAFVAKPFDFAVLLRTVAEAAAA